MHEVSLMQSAIEQALQAADRADASRILGIRLNIGAWSGVVPDALQLAFDVVSRGTAADGAKLVVDTVAARSRCVTCFTDFAPADSMAICPQCGGARTQLLAGNELELASIEVSDP